MELLPLYDRIIVKREAKEMQTPGGLFIPETSKDKPQRGEVLAVGRGKLLPNGVLFAPIVQQGQTVLFGKFSGTEVEINGEPVLIMKEEDIFAVVKSDRA